MARIHVHTHGKSHSTRPTSKSPPSWLNQSRDQVSSLVVKLAKDGLSPSKIGLKLRDEHGIPLVKPVTGKSHTVWFIRYLKEQQKTFGLVWVDLSELASATPHGLVDPGMIARSMALQMAMQDVVHERGEESWAAWTTEFCDSLTGRLTNAPAPWWLVIDNFSAVPLPQDSLDLDDIRYSGFSYHPGT